MAEIFISYSRKHSVYADFLVRDLEDQGYSCWIDTSDIPGGADWEQSIVSAISEALVLIVVVTEAAIQSEWVLKEIAVALNLGKPCVPVIMEELDTQTSLETLGLSAFQGIDFFQDRSRTAFAKLTRTLAQLTDTWQPLSQLVAKLNHYSTKVRRNTIEELGKTKDIRVLEPLITALREEDDLDNYSHIVAQLANFKHPRSKEVVTYIFLHTQDFGIKLTALYALGKIGNNDPEITAVLVNALDDKHHDIQINAAQEMQNFDDPEIRELGFRKLISMLEHQHVNARGNAVSALGKIGDKRAIEPIMNMLNNDSDNNDYARKLALHYLKVLGVDI